MYIFPARGIRAIRAILIPVAVFLETKSYSILRIIRNPFQKNKSYKENSIRRSDEIVKKL